MVYDQSHERFEQYVQQVEVAENFCFHRFGMGLLVLPPWIYEENSLAEE